MSTQEALIEEIKKQPESLLQEVQLYLAFLPGGELAIESVAREISRSATGQGRCEM